MLQFTASTAITKTAKNKESTKITENANPKKRFTITLCLFQPGMTELSAVILKPTEIKNK